jgi:hypothetical protein
MTRRIGHSLETSPAIAKPCPRCRRPLLTGLAEGIHAYVDITPLTPAGEIAAVLAGRQTYTLRRTGLIQRDAYRRADPALASPVLAQHDCLRRTA